jgi:hypothetical protein
MPKGFLMKRKGKGEVKSNSDQLGTESEGIKERERLPAERNGKVKN